MHASDSTHESDDDAALGLAAVLLQGKNSAKPDLRSISLAKDNDTAAPPFFLCKWTLALGI